MYIEFSGLLHHRSVSFEPGPCAGASDRVIHVVLRKAGPAKERSVLGRAAPRESGLTMSVLEVYVEPVVQENRSCLGSGRRPRSVSLHPARPKSFSLRPDARWFLWARACRGRFASVPRVLRSVSPLIKAAAASRTLDLFRVDFRSDHRYVGASEPAFSASGPKRSDTSISISQRSSPRKASS